MLQNGVKCCKCSKMFQNLAKCFKLFQNGWKCCLSYAIFHMLFVKCYLPCTIYYMPYSISYPPYAIYNMPSIMCHLSYTIYHVASTIFHISYAIFRCHLLNVIYHTTFPNVIPYTASTTQILCTLWQLAMTPFASTFASTSSLDPHINICTLECSWLVMKWLWFSLILFKSKSILQVIDFHKFMNENYHILLIVVSKISPFSM